MSWTAEAWPWLTAMGVLIVTSALFSGSEAALFSLNHRSRRGLRRAGIGGRIAARLLENPERLLSAILFWNLLINITYFAVAAIVGTKLETEWAAGHSVAFAFTVISLMTIIFFSEMLPKSVAVLAPARLSILVAPPLSLAIRVVSPLLPIVAAANLIAGRLFWPGFEPEPEIELKDIERAIELGTDDAVLMKRERAALRGLVAVAGIRVSEIMRPRSKLRMRSDASEVFEEGIPRGGYLMVTDAEGESIVETIAVRTLRPSQVDDLSGAAEPVIYVPWSAMVSQVLDQMRDEGRNAAVVVNEFGELMGVVTIDDVLRHVLAPASILQLSPGHFRVTGASSLRRLSKRLEVEEFGEGELTVAGHIQRHNERSPRLGDAAPLGDFVLTVTGEDQDWLWIDAVRTSPAEEGKEEQT